MRVPACPWRLPYRPPPPPARPLPCRADVPLSREAATDRWHLRLLVALAEAAGAAAEHMGVEVGGVPPQVIAARFQKWEDDAEEGAGNGESEAAVPAATGAAS